MEPLILKLSVPSVIGTAHERNLRLSKQESLTAALPVPQADSRKAGMELWHFLQKGSEY